jgi:hypothetical protein
MGAFVCVNLPSILTRTWDTSKLYSEGKISVISTLPEPTVFKLLFGAIAGALRIRHRAFHRRHNIDRIVN